MIVSHALRFVFIKTEKTAGTSLEIALSKYLGEKDIITPISADDEDLRIGLGYPGPQNYYVPIGHYARSDWARLVLTGRRLQYYNHADAAFIRRHVGAAVWDSYFKFAFERNPWDKALSMYWFRMRHSEEPPISLDAYISSGAANDIRGWELYTIGNRLAVDRVFLYEHITDALEELSALLALPERLNLPRAKASFRRDRRHYRDLLSSAAADEIRHAYAREISRFGYSF